jgi:hypothetical protein
LKHGWRNRVKLKYPIDYILWEDHYSEDGWKKIDDIDASAAPVETIGSVIKENDEIVMVALNVCENAEVSCTMVIMKSCIKTRRRIRDAIKTRQVKSRDQREHPGISQVRETTETSDSNRDVHGPKGKEKA